VFVCMRRHQAPEGEARSREQRRGTGGVSSIVSRNYYTGGEGREDGNCDVVYRSIPFYSDIVIYLFIFIFILVCLQSTVHL